MKFMKLCIDTSSFLDYVPSTVKHPIGPILGMVLFLLVVYLESIYGKVKKKGDFCVMSLCWSMRAIVLLTAVPLVILFTYSYIRSLIYSMSHPAPLYGIVLLFVICIMDIILIGFIIDVLCIRSVMYNETGLRFKSIFTKNLWISVPWNKVERINIEFDRIKVICDYGSFSIFLGLKGRKQLIKFVLHFYSDIVGGEIGEQEKEFKKMDDLLNKLNK